MGEHIDSVCLLEPCGASFCAICPNKVDQKVPQGHPVGGQIRRQKCSECQALQSLPSQLDVAALLNDFLLEALPDAFYLDASAHFRSDASIPADGKYYVCRRLSRSRDAFPVPSLQRHRNPE